MREGQRGGKGSLVMCLGSSLGTSAKERDATTELCDPSDMGQRVELRGSADGLSFLVLGCRVLSFPPGCCHSELSAIDHQHNHRASCSSFAMPPAKQPPLGSLPPVRFQFSTGCWFLGSLAASALDCSFAFHLCVEKTCGCL